MKEFLWQQDWQKMSDDEIMSKSLKEADLFDPAFIRQELEYQTPMKGDNTATCTEIVTADQSKQSNVGKIVGGVAGTLLGAGIVGAIVCIIKKRREKKKKQEEMISRRDKVMEDQANEFIKFVNELKSE